MNQPFFQQRVPAEHHIYDGGVQHQNGAILHRTTVNTPPRGYYYVNERSGIYIFTREDWLSKLTITYTDTRAKRDKRRQLTVGGQPLSNV